MSTEPQPFTILDVPTDAFCDPDTGVCAVPLPAMPSPDGEEDDTGTRPAVPAGPPAADSRRAGDRRAGR
ncbi:hypothetical protein GCM10010415_71800 [Streptomyces atrovirens]|uniref:Uncharacterized protein n=1 Tax=Streptomyces atrovirens TaxID=285556 RepID=A0ABW0E341_9ACTN